MKQESCNRLKLEQNGMRVILEFPKESPDEETIKKEVKKLLSYILQEHLSKTP